MSNLKLSANECISLQIGEHSSQPLYTYSIFGDDEEILGYEKLSILLQWDPVTLRPYFGFQAEGETDPKQPDAREILLQYLPSEPDLICGDPAEYIAAIKADKETKADILNGEVIWENDMYEVVRTSFPKAKLLMDRIRILILFLIEGGSYVDDSDTRWKVFFMRDKTSGNILGFCTVYPYLYYEDAASYEKIGSTSVAARNWERDRISQFLIFPPYQRKGLGFRFYMSILTYLQADTQVREITVEEPSEAFEIIRDRGDLRMLTKDVSWPTKTDFKTVLPSGECRQLAKQFKITERQVSRCYELATYRAAGRDTAELQRIIKTRLWQQNYESLEGLDAVACKGLLIGTYENVLAGYRIVLSMLDKSTDKPTDNSPPAKKIISTKTSNKRHDSR